MEDLLPPPLDFRLYSSSELSVGPGLLFSGGNRSSRAAAGRCGTDGRVAGDVGTYSSTAGHRTVALASLNRFRATDSSSALGVLFAVRVFPLLSFMRPDYLIQRELINNAHLAKRELAAAYLMS